MAGIVFLIKSFEFFLVSAVVVTAYFIADTLPISAIIVLVYAIFLRSNLGPMDGMLNYANQSIKVLIHGLKNTFESADGQDLIDTHQRLSQTYAHDPRPFAPQGAANAAAEGAKYSVVAESILGAVIKYGLILHWVYDATISA